MKNRLIALLLFALSGHSTADEWGRFVGDVQTRWMIDGRNMELLSDVSYIAPNGEEWRAQKGSVVNGASIPRFAWTIIGGPYEGTYRNASVIHDVACDERKKSWREVHRTFYTAMRASKVDPTKAKVMYAAVYHFGPRWSEPKRVVLKTATAPKIGEEILQIKRSSGLSSEVVMISEGKSIEHRAGLFGYRKEVQISGAVVEVRERSPDYSEEAFKAMEDAIANGDLSIEEIENLSPSL